MKLRLALATLYTPEIAGLQELTVASKREWCARWGHVYLEGQGTLDATRPPAWSKLLWIKKHLAAFDWIWWLDVDARIMNPAFDAETLLDPVHDLIVCKARLKDPFGGHNINTGSFFIRNSPWAHAILDRVYAQEHFIEHLCWEQAAICHLYESDPEVREHVRVDLDTAGYNSFVSDYRKGHFVFHAVEPRRKTDAKEILLRRVIEEDTLIDFPKEPAIRVLAMISEENCEAHLQVTLGSLAREAFVSGSSPIELVNLRHADFVSVGGYASLHRLWLEKVAAALIGNPGELLLVVSDPVQFFAGWERSLLLNLGKKDLLISGWPEADRRLIFLRNSPAVNEWLAGLVQRFDAWSADEKSSAEGLSSFWQKELADSTLLVGGFDPAAVLDQPRRLGMNIVNLKIQLPLAGETAEQTLQHFAITRQQREKCVSSVGEFLLRDHPGGFMLPQNPSPQ